MTSRLLSLLLLVLSAASAAEMKYALILSDAPIVDAVPLSTRAEVQNMVAAGHRQSILAKQAVLQTQLTRRGYAVTAAMQHLLNAVFVIATPDQVKELSGLPGVKGVVPVRRYTRKLNKAVQLVNAPVAWNMLGGVGNAGYGVKIAILDTGIDNTHPAFHDASLPMPAGFPVCPQPTDCMFTSNKVIVARSYVSALAAGTGSDPIQDSRPDDFSARDLVGHGTALASIAAGETTVAPLVTINGMAPRAYLGNYKIFGSEEINGFTDSSAIDPALEDAATKDHMNVAVLSLGGPAFTGPADSGAACGYAAGVPCDIDSVTVENAVKAGMVVVVAGGNEGQNGQNSNTQTLDSVSSPGVAADAITVAATTNSHIFKQDLHISGPNVPGALVLISEDMGNSIIPPSPLTAPLVDGAKLNNSLGCSAFSAGSLQGSIALVSRGTCTFLVKAQNIAAGGGVGMILINTANDPVIPMGGLSAAPIPSASISSSDGSNLMTYLASNTGVSATIPPGYLEEVATPNQIASFSSIGPAMGGGLKPEIAAPGTAIYMATQSYDPYGGLYDPSRYISADGTSFATPIVAGGAALVIQKNPKFTPLQVKSALVNTAARPVGPGEALTGNQVGSASSNYSVLEAGAGILDAGAAVSTNVTIQPSTVSFGALKAGSQALSQPLLLTNTGSSSVTLSLTISRTVLDSSTTLSIDKTSVTLAPNSSSTVTFSLNGTRSVAGGYEGAIEVAGGSVPLHVPFFYGSPDTLANDYYIYNGSGITGTEGHDLANGISFLVIDRYGFPLANTRVAFTVTTPTTATLKNTDTTTNQFGIAQTDITFASQPCSTGCTATVTATVGRKTLTFTNFARPQPTISANGVADAASYSTAGIVPGSFIAIFGSGLSDTTETNFVPFLPLGLGSQAFVFVSFDAPGLSLPGRLYYASDKQIDVQVPWELAGATSVKMKVTIDQSAGNVVTVPVLTAAPAIFSYTDSAANGMVAAALDENYQLIGTANAVARGHIAQIYANALGPVTDTPADGYAASSNPLSHTKLSVTATVGGQPATVQFSGLAPGFAGLYQVNLVVPQSVATGLQPVILSVNGVNSPAVNLQVK
jgi:minor extracellular serine protease Vpr